MLLSYKEIVEKYRKNREREMIPNGSASHAVVLIEQLFILAKNEKLDVKIVSGCLDSAIYNNFVNLAKEVLENNCIDIIVLDFDKVDFTQNEFYKTVISSENGSISKFDEDDKTIHFVLVGDSAYRLEMDDDTREAVGNFGDVSLGKRLEHMFKELSNTSTRTGTPSSNASVTGMATHL